MKTVSCFLAGLCACLALLLSPPSAQSATIEVNSGSIDLLIYRFVTFPEDTWEREAVSESHPVTLPGSGSYYLSSDPNSAFGYQAMSMSYGFQRVGNLVTFNASGFGRLPGLPDASDPYGPSANASLSLSFTTDRPAWLDLHVDASPWGYTGGSFDTSNFGRYWDDALAQSAGNIPFDLHALLPPGQHSLFMQVVPWIDHGFPVDSQGSVTMELQFVPLPAAVWGGASLLLGLGTLRTLRHSRQ